jgi:hypothetical protein
VCKKKTTSPRGVSRKKTTEVFVEVVYVNSVTWTVSCQLPQGLHGSGCHTWQSATLRPTTGQTPRRFRRHQAGLVCRPGGFSTFFSSAAMRRSWNHFPTRWGGFCTSGTSGTSTDMVPVPSTGTAAQVRPLTSFPSSRGQSSGGALWRDVYTPGWRLNQSVVLHHPCTVPVYNLLCIQ